MAACRRWLASSQKPCMESQWYVYVTAPMHRLLLFLIPFRLNYKYLILSGQFLALCRQISNCIIIITYCVQIVILSCKRVNRRCFYECFFFSSLSQNGIVQKDLTRLKMLLTEIEVSVRSYTAPNDSGLPASVSNFWLL